MMVISDGAEAKERHLGPLEWLLTVEGHASAF